MIDIGQKVFLNEAEIKFSFIRSPGPGGQNVNKVASAVLLRFNVKYSPSLPEGVRERLLSLLSSRLTLQGELLIKATTFRTQAKNKQDALARLVEIIHKALHAPKKRKKTKLSKAVKKRRLLSKKKHGLTKSLRHKISDE